MIATRSGIRAPSRIQGRIERLLKEVERLAAVRENARLDTARSADEPHLELGDATPQLLDYGKPWEEVTARAATSDHHAPDHWAPPLAGRSL